MDEHIPDTQTSGMLVPPPRVPPGAVATAAPLPPRPPRRDRVARVSRARGLPGLLVAALDQLDELGDRIANAVGIRTGSA